MVSRPSASYSITMRVEIQNRPGMLGRVTSAIGKAGGDIGAVDIAGFGTDTIVRDLTVNARDEAHEKVIAAAVGRLPGVRVVNVSDRTFLLHLGGKITVNAKSPIKTRNDLSMVYTPGVARVCMAIHEDPKKAYQLTIKKNTVAVITDGSAVLGLGNIGPAAAMPVMEGKAALMETLCGLSGVPILLDTKDPDAIVATLASIAPTFSAIQLEDISAPRCFEIETRLQELVDIPVLHDDQHGTACVVIAALLNAEKAAGAKPLLEARIGVIGLGAAGMAISRMLMHFTNRPVLGADLAEGARRRLERAGGKPAGLSDIMGSCDVVVAVTGAPGLIKPETVRQGQIILALSNPKPEIEPAAARAAGAAFAADGKAVNNVLGFPGIFRGAVDADVRRITQDMLLAAARAIAASAPSGEIVPSPLDKSLHRRVARAVARVALDQGLNRDDLTGYFGD